MKMKIWKHKQTSVFLTTESSSSHYGIPVLRILSPSGEADCGPADIAPHPPGEAPGTAAALLCAINGARPLTGDALAAAKAFLAQWPAGPQLD